MGPKGPKGLQKGHTLNDIRWANKRPRTDAGAPVPTPCSPRACRFRRARPLGGSEYQRTADIGWVENRLLPVALCASGGSMQRRDLRCRQLRGRGGRVEHRSGSAGRTSGLPPGAVDAERAHSCAGRKATEQNRLMGGWRSGGGDLGRLGLHGLSGTIGLHRVRSGLNGRSGRIGGACAARGA